VLATAIARQRLLLVPERNSEKGKAVLEKTGF
jgi:hypothetical protein